MNWGLKVENLPLCLVCREVHVLSLVSIRNGILHTLAVKMCRLTYCLSIISTLPVHLPLTSGHFSLLDHLLQNWYVSVQGNPSRSAVPEISRPAHLSNKLKSLKLPVFFPASCRCRIIGFFCSSLYWCCLCVMERSECIRVYTPVMNTLLQSDVGKGEVEKWSFGFAGLCTSSPQL